MKSAKPSWKKKHFRCLCHFADVSVGPNCVCQKRPHAYFYIKRKKCGEADAGGAYRSIMNMIQYFAWLHEYCTPQPSAFIFRHSCRVEEIGVTGRQSNSVCLCVCERERKQYHIYSTAMATETRVYFRMRTVVFVCVNALKGTQHWMEYNKF